MSKRVIKKTHHSKSAKTKSPLRPVSKINWSTISLFAIVIVLLSFVFMQMRAPANINMVVDVGKETPSPIPTGCYLKQVQCVKAPCEPVLICNQPTSPSPRPSTAPQVDGILTFTASAPCGISSFMNISFTCKDGRIKEMAKGQCTEIAPAIIESQKTCIGGK